MVGWHHRLDGNEFQQALGDSEGQENLACMLRSFSHVQLCVML